MSPKKRVTMLRRQVELELSGYTNFGTLITGTIVLVTSVPKRAILVQLIVEDATTCFLEHHVLDSY